MGLMSYVLLDHYRDARLVSHSGEERRDPTISDGWEE
jgi:hypothetical protein